MGMPYQKGTGKNLLRKERCNYQQGTRKALPRKDEYYGIVNVRFTTSYFQWKQGWYNIVGFLQILKNKILVEIQRTNQQDDLDSLQTDEQGNKLIMPNL